MNNLNLYSPNYCHEDMINDVTLPIAEYIEEISPNTVKIIDPYFEIQVFQEFLNNYTPNKAPRPINAWTFLFDELLKLDSLKEAYIITTDLFKDYMQKNQMLLNLNLNDNGYIFKCKDKVFNFFYYANPKNTKYGKYNLIPDLHDRWILLCNENETQGIHVGCSLNDSIGKDITITTFNSDGAEKANKRYDDLLRFSKERVKW